MAWGQSRRHRQWFTHRLLQSRCWRIARAHQDVQIPIYRTPSDLVAIDLAMYADLKFAACAGGWWTTNWCPTSSAPEIDDAEIASDGSRNRLGR